MKDIASREVNTMKDLAERIKELEALEVIQIERLKSEAFNTAQSFRPSNLFKNALSDMAGSSSFKKEALKASVGIGAGMLIKKIMFRNSQTLFKKIAGYGLQFLTSKVVANKFSVLKKKTAGL